MGRHLVGKIIVLIEIILSVIFSPVIIFPSSEITADIAHPEGIRI